GLQLEVVHRELVEAQNRVVARHIGVMHRGAIDGLSASDRFLPDRQVVADGETFRVADHHPDDRPTIWNPGVHERPDTGLREKDLVTGTTAWHVGILRKSTLMRPPTELGWRGPFLIKSLDGPCVHKFVDRLGSR